MRALTVDDSKLVRRLVARTLGDLGFEVDEAADGQEALWNLFKKGAADLVILDWNMPVVDGLEFLKRMRKRDDFAEIKVIMLTARNEQQSVVEAVQSGADEYVMKPFSREALEEKVRMVMGLEEPQ